MIATLEIHRALQQPDAELALRNLVKLWHREGISKSAAFVKLNNFKEMTPLSEGQVLAIEAVIAALKGNCDPKKRLIPGKPDVMI